MAAQERRFDGRLTPEAGYGGDVFRAHLYLAPAELTSEGAGPTTQSRWQADADGCASCRMEPIANEASRAGIQNSPSYSDRVSDDVYETFAGWVD